MWKQKILLLCLAIFLVSCGKSPDDYEQDREGIYYQEIGKKTIGQKYNSMAQYTRRLLLYNDRIYSSYVSSFSTGSFGTEREDLHLDDILGNELTTVKGNHSVFWSADGKKLSEVTTEGILYQVKGYDEDFRVGIYYEISMPFSDPYCYLAIFEQLNGLTLHEGRELFEERLHLGETVRIEGMGKSESSKCELAIDSTEVKEFLEALYEGVFVDSTGALNTKESCALSFYDPNNLVTNIRVYADGYVVMDRNSENIFFIKVEASKCRNIVELVSD